ncbi:MAG: methionyl-tRNA formyltransferase [Gammaproteobacteria bacterium]|nr:methionyl-tRNA formyltransferase [Gammaproteobacteria bacterium]
MNNPLKIIFAGTPEFAAIHLRALLNSEHQVIAVYSQPDRPSGRGKKLLVNPVKQFAMQHNLEVFQPLTLRGKQAQTELAALGADIMVVVAYGLLLPQVILDTPRLGCINVHASLLPRWRGAAPIQRALEAGDHESGISIMQMEAGLDTGPVLVEARTSISDNETSGSLHDKLALLGGPALFKALSQLHLGKAQPQVQDENNASYAAKTSKQEAVLDWRQSAIELERKIRAFNPTPVCWTTFGGSKNEQRLRIFAAKLEAGSHSAPPGTILNADHRGILVACGHKDPSYQQLRLTSLQLPGKKPTTAADILKGYPTQFSAGNCLGQPPADIQ